MIPAEIWRRNSENVTKLIVRDKEIKSITLDAKHQTADADHDNNTFPPQISKSRIEMYKSNYRASSMMADMLVELKGNPDEKKSDSSKKSVPLKSQDMKSSDKKSKGSGTDYKADKKDEKKKSSLRKTLEKMMSNK
jgi:hypothetical protein